MRIRHSLESLIQKVKVWSDAYRSPPNVFQAWQVRGGLSRDTPDTPLKPRAAWMKRCQVLNVTCCCSAGAPDSQRNKEKISCRKDAMKPTKNAATDTCTGHHRLGHAKPLDHATARSGGARGGAKGMERKEEEDLVATADAARGTKPRQELTDTKSISARDLLLFPVRVGLADITRIGRDRHVMCGPPLLLSSRTLTPVAPRAPPREPRRVKAEQ
ncbi:hypothetical protein E2C01_039398 [Portunus trituberculatus]|uniref:Uncharacterized protein n=1 Tax=Portunus trituberculatus TaxID=210409 RepID=A0A5B7FGR5_PORTR|nr:hypothetical protein [Portunus trituberculatus]